jgi:hypothetical protein
MSKRMLVESGNKEQFSKLFKLIEEISRMIYGLIIYFQNIP